MVKAHYKNNVLPNLLCVMVICLKTKSDLITHPPPPSTASTIPCNAGAQEIFEEKQLYWKNH